MMVMVISAAEIYLILFIYGYVFVILADHPAVAEPFHF